MQSGTLTFQQVNYDVLMGIRDPVSRWLMKRLHTGFDASGAAVQEMLASEIRRDSGTPEWRTTRNLLARMSRAVQVLVDKGLLDQIEAFPVMDSRTKTDIVYTMILSPLLHDGGSAFPQDCQGEHGGTSSASPAVPVRTTS